jgi:low temperature requirement protein LtrA
VRTLHLALYALAARGMPALLRNVLLLAPSTMASGLLILGASFLETGLREVIWIIAIGIDYLGPALYDASGWELSPRHFVERHGLIFLIALGESIVALGLAASHLELDARTIIATMLGLTVVVAMWWTYFDVVAIVAGQRLEQAPEKEQGAMARDSYSYLHMPMVAGVILFALGVKTALPDLTTSLNLTPAAALCGGFTLYLVAHILFRIRNVHSINRPRTVAAAVSAALVVVSQQVSGLVLLVLVAAVAVTLVTYETVVYREARTRVRASNH